MLPVIILLLRLWTWWNMKSGLPILLFGLIGWVFFINHGYAWYLHKKELWVFCKKCTWSFVKLITSEDTMKPGQRITYFLIFESPTKPHWLAMSRLQISYLWLYIDTLQLGLYILVGIFFISQITTCSWTFMAHACLLQGCTATVLLIWFDQKKDCFAQCANLGDSACIMK
jgi:hypothetical protein